MEQLLVKADGLHREAALLSNTLHQYADADVEGAKTAVDKILSLRNEWRSIRAKIEYLEKTGKLPEDTRAEAAASTNAVDSGTISELKLEVQRINTNISKHKKKLEINPDHKKAEQWKEDMAKMEAMKIELRTKIIELTYAAK